MSAPRNAIYGKENRERAKPGYRAYIAKVSADCSNQTYQISFGSHKKRLAQESSPARGDMRFFVFCIVLK